MIPFRQVHAVGSILYAAPGGLNSGLCDNWSAACDLQRALLVAANGNEIWLQQGIYKPTTGTDRSISFVMKDGVSLYGGFVGTETQREQRSLSASLTVVSGEIGSSTDATDNSYHVVVSSGTTNATVIDGFTITGGYANGDVPNNSGAGMYNDGGNLKLNNIIFDLNKSIAVDYPVPSLGGGMYNINGSPAFTNVIFTNNTVTQPGYSGECKGGGIYNENSASTFTNVEFNGNQATTPGLGQCGGAGMYSKDSNLSLTNMTFANNLGNHMGWPNASLGSAGGGIWNDGGTLIITQAQFNNNTAHFGAGIFATSSTLTISDAKFSNNTAHYYGGGIRVTNGSLTITDSSFSGNQAGLIGGGICNLYGTAALTLTNLTFQGNSADAGGGFASLPSSDSALNLTNSTFKENTVGYGGAGVFLRQNTGTLNHLSFQGNTSTNGQGGALYNSGASPTIQNSIFWGDGSEIFNDSTSGYGVSTPLIKDSVIATGCPVGASCTHVISADPKLGPLADNGGSTQTMALLPGSSAIDVGGLNSTCAATDQRGLSRPQGNGCDMGAFEVAASILANSVLPTSRSVQVGNLATIYHTLINAGTSAAQNVSLSMVNMPPGAFAYKQTDCATNAATGPINPVLNVPGGGIVCYVLMFTPSAQFNATQVQIRAQTAFVTSTSYPGVNTWVLRATNSPEADIIALTTTTDFHQISCRGTKPFAVALANVGAAASGDITVTANTGSLSLPLSTSIMESDPATGNIIGDHILQNVGAGENRALVVFVTFNNCIGFDPAHNRIFIEFRDGSNNLIGSTSTAVSTNR
jgi:predicted outer membrane repeat protein